MNQSSSPISTKSPHAEEVLPLPRRRTRPSGTLRFWLLRTAYILIALLGLTAVLSLVVLIFGSVSGTEFSPESLETRSFSYYEIPGVCWQVSPIVRKVTVGGVEQQLQNQKLVSVLPASRWDLVNAQRMTDWIDPRGASILTLYLRARSAENLEFWVDWNGKHSELAEVLWPEVVRLARRRCYVFIPDLMKLARQAADGLELEHPPEVPPRASDNGSAEWAPETLQREIEKTLERRFRQLAEISRDRGQAELAQQLLAWAEEYSP